MTPKQQLDKLAAYLLAQKEEVNVQLDYDELVSILHDVKQDLTEHEALKKDVARYFELFMNRKRTIHESTEILDLFVKLSKVGKKSD